MTAYGVILSYDGLFRTAWRWDHAGNIWELSGIVG